MVVIDKHKISAQISDCLWSNCAGMHGFGDAAAVRHQRIIRMEVCNGCHWWKYGYFYFKNHHKSMYWFEVKFGCKFLHRISEWQWKNVYPPAAGGLHVQRQACLVRQQWVARQADRRRNVRLLGWFRSKAKVHALLPLFAQSGGQRRFRRLSRRVPACGRHPQEIYLSIASSVMVFICVL